MCARNCDKEHRFWPGIRLYCVPRRLGRAHSAWMFFFERTAEVSAHRGYKNSKDLERGDCSVKAASVAKTPTTPKRTVARGRLPNANYRTREYLTEREVERLMKAAGDNRHGHRDATMILMAFRHSLRASALCSLRWDQADLVHGRLHVNRLKNGIPSVHPLTGIELRALRRLQRKQKPVRYVFMSERGAPMSAVAFRRMVTRLGSAAKMPFGIHP